MRVLIIKLTSMGDLMHALPAITDALNYDPTIRFDWVVDASFAEVPAWHHGVVSTIQTAHRRWKKKPLHFWRNGELTGFYKQLNAQDYDVVVDLQGNLKSAAVAWLRKGDVHGYDRESCREKPAYKAYRYPHAVTKNMHAVERQRNLMAQAIGYEKPGTSPDYGVDLSVYNLPDIDLPKPYVMLVHNASQDEKMWPVSYWQGLVSLITAAGYYVLLPCGSDAEHQRAKTIAGANEYAMALPKLSLNQTAAIMINAKAAVCSDTGLAHMAAVAATPAITLYAVTDVALIGTEGKNQQHIIAESSGGMADISVDHVWDRLQLLLD